MGVTATLSRVDQDRKDKRLPDPCIVVVFGASGDLTKRKLLPALFHLKQVGLLREEFAVVGVARRDLSARFVPEMRGGIFKGGGVAETDPRLDSFLDRVKYFQTNFDDDDGFERLKHYLAELDEELGTHGNRLFYLAVAPEYFADIIARLGAHGMAQSGEEADNWVRVVTWTSSTFSRALLAPPFPLAVPKTRKQWWESRPAMARPIPDETPVTRATFS